MTNPELDWLDKILNKYVANYDLEVLRFRESGQQAVIRAILSHIRELIEGIIGEDKPRPYRQTSEYGDAQNDLRAEQRKKAKELLKRQDIE